MRLTVAVLVLLLAGGVAAGDMIAASTAPAADEPSLWARAISWIYLQQRLLHRELAAAMQAWSAGGGTLAAWGLISASFLYGIFHAAGPGHGKVVLTTYLLAQRERVAGGVAIAAMAAFVQGLVALALVYGLIYLAGWLPRDTTAAVAWSERFSFVLVAGLGGWLVYRAVRHGLAVWRAPAPAAAPARAAVPHQHDHDHDACGHSHGPSVTDLDRATDLRARLGVVLSIGIRPCTGAILVLILARVMGLPGAGVAAVMAMSAGTAIAVAGLAFLAVHARQIAGNLLVSRGLVWRLSSDAVALTGGLILLLVGMSLLMASFAPRHPLGL